MLDELLEEWVQRFPPDPALEGSYVGRFAPSPTGPLHLGSLVAALASYLDAKAHQGRWLVRIDDLDQPRCVPGAGEAILASLAALGLQADGEVVWQSRRHGAYRDAFERLREAGAVFPCACTRREIADSRLHPTQRGREAVYPGTCRHGLAPGRLPRAWRMRTGQTEIRFNDRWQGETTQDLASEVGDFVLLRADGQWAYQLAVVVDDAAAGVTDVVRGADLIESTPRQILVQQSLGLPTPRYLHVPVVTNAQGEKLSKQTEAPAIALTPEGIRRAMQAAGKHLFG